jgi:molybdenum cofactor biosynthesis protein A
MSSEKLVNETSEMRRAGETAAGGEGMRDGFGRQIEYLRISVTDKCNLRCVYCMPEHGLPWLARAEILTYEEIETVVREMAALGLRRIRLTGGEPLVRRDVARLVRLLRAVPGIDDIALSTNAVLLGAQADELRDAGVNRVNISLDSLQPARVDAIARRPGSHRAIFDGIDAAERVGFDPIKINAVIMRGRNDDEIEDFARITLDRPWHVRFIEVMPVGENLDVSATEFVAAAEMLNTVRSIGSIRPSLIAAIAPCPYLRTERDRMTHSSGSSHAGTVSRPRPPAASRRTRGEKCSRESGAEDRESRTLPPVARVVPPTARATVRRSLPV